MFRSLCIRLFVVISHGKTVGASGTPTKQDAENHYHRLCLRRQVKRCMGRENVQTVGSFKRIRTQMPREVCLYHGWTLFGCAYSFSEQEQANTTTIECVCGPSDLRRGTMNHSCSQITRTEQQTHASSSDEPTGELGRKI